MSSLCINPFLHPISVFQILFNLQCVFSSFETFPASMLLVLHTFLLWRLPPAAATECYFPDGSLADDVPCITGDEWPWCCSYNSVCMSNGLCRYTDHSGSPDAIWPDLYVQGSCTTFTSPVCLNMCNAGSSPPYESDSDLIKLSPVLIEHDRSAPRWRCGLGLQ